MKLPKPPKARPPAKKKRKRHTQRACGKVRYRDHGEAITALRTIRSRDDSRDRVPVRVYECHACGGWHMTAQVR